MRFDSHNIDQFNNIYFHDSAFEGFVYCYQLDMRHMIELSCKLYWPEKKQYFLKFCNVAYQEIQSFTLWAGGNAIMWVDAQLTADEEIQTILNAEKARIKESGWNTEKTNSAVPLITIDIRLNSGDRVKIICESIEVAEKRNDCSEK